MADRSKDDMPSIPGFEMSTAAERTVRYATVEETMEAFYRTLPLHDAAYRELAKGPEGVVPHEPAPFDLKRW